MTIVAILVFGIVGMGFVASVFVLIDVLAHHAECKHLRITRQSQARRDSEEDLVQALREM